MTITHRDTKYIDMRVVSNPTAEGGVFSASILCTAVAPDGTKRKDHMVWFGRSKKAMQLKKEADTALDDFLARGHVSRV